MTEVSRALMLQKFLRYARVLGMPSALASAVGKVAGRTFTITLRRPDIAHPLHFRVPSTDMDGYEQIFVQKQYEFQVTQMPKIIVDAGANIGIGSVYFGERFPQARIYAVECEPSNFEMLKRNVAAYPNIVPIHAALWDRDGEINIIDPGLGNWGFMATKDANPPGRVSKVRAMSLQTLMTEHDIPHIDVLKMDIEGAELEVLNGSAAWIGKVDMLIAELHDRLKPGCEASFERATSSFPSKWRQGENSYAARATLEPTH